jgi:membrane protease YdiL (CAAX protease family)
MLSTGEVLTFGLLSAAVAALWLRPRRGGDEPRAAPVLLLLALAAVVGLCYGLVDAWGLASLALLAGLGWATYRSRLPVAARAAAGAGLLALAGGLALHLVPGFDNPKVIAGEVLTPGALPYTRYLNFDKTAVGVVLLLFGGGLIAAGREWGRMLRFILPVVGVLVAVVLPLALVLGHVRFEPALRPHLVLWAWTNLFFTCVAEEALFRGFIQRRLERWLEGWRHGGALSLAAAAALFGLAHLAGGWGYVLLSTVAGLGYGWAMRRSGRIEGAIVAHFLLNALHFGLFTYPALAVG